MAQILALFCILVKLILQVAPFSLSNGISEISFLLHSINSNFKDWRTWVSLWCVHRQWTVRMVLSIPVSPGDNKVASDYTINRCKYFLLIENSVQVQGRPHALLEQASARHAWFYFGLLRFDSKPLRALVGLGRVVGSPHLSDVCSINVCTILVVYVLN